MTNIAAEGLSRVGRWEVGRCRAICGTSSHNNDDVGDCEFKRASSPQWGSNFIIMQHALAKRANKQKILKEKTVTFNDCQI